MTTKIQASKSDPIKSWILSKHKNRTDIGPTEDLIENRLVDSLSFVEFVFRIEEASGRDIDLDNLDLADVRTLAAIESRFLSE